MEVTAEQVIEAARKRWPEANSISVVIGDGASVRSMRINRKWITKTIEPYMCSLSVCKQRKYKSGSEYVTGIAIEMAHSLAALLQKIEGQDAVATCVHSLMN